MEVDNAVPFELEPYIAPYTGHNRLNRLVFIAERAANTPLELEALRLAHDEVKKTENTQLYSVITERIAGRLGPAYNFDKSWADAVDRRAAAKQERMESELHSHKANLIKESIRLSHNDLGDFFYERGDLQNALKCYVRARDYCTSSRHILSLCLSVIRTSVEMGNYLHVANYVSKAETTPDLANMDPLITSKLAAAQGLNNLYQRRFKMAARKFLEVSPELGSMYSDVITLQDVALYGSLCALASFDRDELGRRVVANVQFKEMLGTVPEIRDIVMDFHACRYAQCLRALQQMTPTLTLDMHLSEYVPSLLKQIRERALIQYTFPFSSVNLASMAAAFNTTVPALDKELASLIMDGQIAARIDSGAGVLYARHADARTQTFSRVLATCQDYLRDTKAALLRAKLLQHNMVEQWGGQGGEGGAGDGPRAGGSRHPGEGRGPGGGGGGGGRRGERGLRGMGSAGMDDDGGWGSGMRSGFLDRDHEPPVGRRGSGRERVRVPGRSGGSQSQDPSA